MNTTTLKGIRFLVSAIRRGMPLVRFTYQAVIVTILCAPAGVDANHTLSLSELIVGESASTKGAFPLVGDGHASSLWFDAGDHKGVIRAIGDLRLDIERVTGRRPDMVDQKPDSAAPMIIGTVGHSMLIDDLIATGKLDGSALIGKWESFVIATLANPMPGVEQALVIAGSDKRGTIFGIYELSRQFGVSPWYYWADAPVLPREELFIKPGTYASGEPKVKYRGIFINDEAPALRNWAQEKFGGFNHKFYEKVFELILRSKGNYLWPAMWVPTAFSDDDPENPRLADEYGIVISTSHHEPMMRAHAEWYRFGGGHWNYETNKARLHEFWRGGIERMGDYESVVIMGMRGDGDEALSEETAVDLLKTIITDQRTILADVTGKPAKETPQVWALYKEVQDYYDKGMRVDDDILILFSDDNWGNVRILPKQSDLHHEGGYGMYYHFDYVGGPVSYRWLNVTQIERVWEQMKLTYDWGVRDLWIVNVGDIKPMELPMSFFLDFAWDPEAISADELPDYYVSWARQQFGNEFSEEIAELLALYTKYNGRRTPEMLAADIYSIENYREADRIANEYQQLLERAERVYAELPESHRAAFYQLVLFPIAACSNLNQMYVAAGKNAYYATRGAASANHYADKVKEFFERDAELTRIFHEELADGKWNHMMSQTHIGYTYWNHPPMNKMPAVSYVHAQPTSELGYLIEYGARPRWGWKDVEGDWSLSPAMPVFDPINDQNYYVEIINRGEESIDYGVTARHYWIQVSRGEGSLQSNEKIYVSIDWAKAPQGRSEGEIVISGPTGEYVVAVPVRNDIPIAQGFVENDGVISIEAALPDRKTDAGGASWITIPNLGRTGSAVTISPSNADRRIPDDESPSLEYTFTLFDPAEVKVDTYLSPTLNYKKNEGLKFAIAIDDENPQVINMHEGETVPDWDYPEWWEKSVGDRIKIKRSSHNPLEAGIHTLKVWMIDPGVVIQKFVIDAGGLKPSYLGPPASVHQRTSTTD